MHVNNVKSSSIIKANLISYPKEKKKYRVQNQPPCAHNFQKKFLNARMKHFVHFFITKEKSVTKNSQNFTLDIYSIQTYSSPVKQCVYITKHWKCH